MENQKDDLLWKQAKERVDFKKHVLVYFVVNAFLWVIWLIGHYKENDEAGIPWPAYSTFGWGIGLMFNFLSVYVFHNKSRMIQKEYDKLVNKNKP